MIVCLERSHNARYKSREGYSTEPTSMVSESPEQQIQHSFQGHSIEVHRASEALKAMLAKVKNNNRDKYYKGQSLVSGKTLQRNEGQTAVNHAVDSQGVFITSCNKTCEFPPLSDYAVSCQLRPSPHFESSELTSINSWHNKMTAESYHQYSTNPVPDAILMKIQLLEHSKA